MLIQRDNIERLCGWEHDYRLLCKNNFLYFHIGNMFFGQSMEMTEAEVRQLVRDLNTFLSSEGESK